MSEPTKEQIDEAREMVPIFDGYLSTVNGCPHISVHGLARLISHVRKQARDDALEAARDIVDCVRFTTTAPEYEGEMVEQAAQEMMRQIVELKDQPSGEQL